MISKALLKHGYSNFTLEILEYCDSKDLINREQYYIDLLNPGYNILKIAGSRLGSIHTEKTLPKMSESLKGEKHPMFGKQHNEDTLAKMSAIKQGKLHSEKTRAKMSISKAGEKHPMFGKLHSEETRAKISSSLLGEKNPMCLASRPKGLGKQE